MLVTVVMRSTVEHRIMTDLTQYHLEGFRGRRSSRGSSGGGAAYSGNTGREQFLLHGRTRLRQYARHCSEYRRHSSPFFLVFLLSEFSFCLMCSLQSIDVGRATRRSVE